MPRDDREGENQEDTRGWRDGEERSRKGSGVFFKIKEVRKSPRFQSQSQGRLEIPRDDN